MRPELGLRCQRRRRAWSKSKRYLSSQHFKQWIDGGKREVLLTLNPTYVPLYIKKYLFHCFMLWRRQNVQQ